MFAFAFEKCSIGTLRETFFYNQVAISENLTSSKKADFIVNDKYTFEIGGKNKDKSQIVYSDDVDPRSGHPDPLKG